MFDSKFVDNVLAMSGSIAERRQAAEREQQEKATLRTESLAGLRSPDITPRRRIAMWEHLHGLHLPTDRKHALIEIVAKRTALRVEDIRNEQERRSLERLAAAGA